MTNCYCYSNKVYTDCCEPFISGSSFPTTPEQLMRSRFSAFVLADVEYLKSTASGPALEEFDEQETKEWAEHVKWNGLEILSAPSVAEADTKGYVEFIAKLQHCNGVHNMHEISLFQRKKGRWYFVDSKDTEEVKKPKIKIGRNSLCPCGSSKKYKKCCGA